MLKNECVLVEKNLVEKTYGSKELEFAIFCIENIAVSLKRDAQEVYRILTEDTHILNDYIIAEYEMLHTQSREYIVNDIIDFMKESALKVLKFDSYTEEWLD